MSRGTIRRFLETIGADSLRIFEVNMGRPFFGHQVALDSLRRAGSVKLNNEEMPVLASISDLAESAHELPEWLRERYGLRLVALTHGAVRTCCSGATGSQERGDPGRGQAYGRSGRRIHRGDGPQVAAMPGVGRHLPPHLPSCGVRVLSSRENDRTAKEMKV